jgi:hypothetical protein
LEGVSHLCFRYSVIDPANISTINTGAGNIGDAGVKGVDRKDADVIPEAAVRNSININHHTGRGGAGNEQHAGSEETAAPAEKAATAGTPASPRGLADKLKNKIFGAFKK